MDSKGGGRNEPGIWGCSIGQGGDAHQITNCDLCLGWKIQDPLVRPHRVVRRQLRAEQGCCAGRIANHAPETTRRSGGVGFETGCDGGGGDMVTSHDLSGLRSNSPKSQRFGWHGHQQCRSGGLLYRYRGGLGLITHFSSRFLRGGPWAVICTILRPKRLGCLTTGR